MAGLSELSGFVFLRLQDENETLRPRPNFRDSKFGVNVEGCNKIEPRAQFCVYWWDFWNVLNYDTRCEVL